MFVPNSYRRPTGNTSHTHSEAPSVVVTQGKAWCAAAVLLSPPLSRYSELERECDAETIQHEQPSKTLFDEGLTYTEGNCAKTVGSVQR